MVLTRRDKGLLSTPWALVLGRKAGRVGACAGSKAGRPHPTQALPRRGHNTGLWRAEAGSPRPWLRRCRWPQPKPGPGAAGETGVGGAVQPQGPCLGGLLQVQGAGRGWGGGRPCSEQLYFRGPGQFLLGLRVMPLLRPEVGLQVPEAEWWEVGADPLPDPPLTLGGMPAPRPAELVPVVFPSDPPAWWTAGRQPRAPNQGAQLWGTSSLGGQPSACRAAAAAGSGPCWLLGGSSCLGRLRSPCGAPGEPLTPGPGPERESLQGPRLVLGEGGRGLCRGASGAHGTEG